MLLDLLEDSAPRVGDLAFVSDPAERLPIAEVWKDCDRAGTWLHDQVGAGGRVAAVLTASRPGLTSLLAAFKSGITLGSLPLPARGMSPIEYQAQIEQLCAMLGCDLLLVDSVYVPLIPELPVRVATFEDCAAGAPGKPPPPVPGRLVQFTSGSTASPKGISLSMDALAANVSAMLDIIEPRRGDRAFSWLPLSHDMGLVGIVLASLCAGAPRWGARDGLLALMKPEDFLGRPHSWVGTIGELGATITAAPPFAMGLACRNAHRLTSPDLTSLRVCVTGAEQVRPDVLREFQETFAAAGLDPRCLSPAYGLAEASLAVTMVRPGQLWTSKFVDVSALGDQRWEEVPPGPGAAEIVGCGQPVAQAECRIDGNSMGEIQIRGASMMSGYVGGESVDLRDGWFSTKDLGAIVDDELFVIGRLDDMFSVSGENYFAHELEAAVSAAHPGVRSGAVGVVEADGGYVVVAETRGQTEGTLREAAQLIRVTLVRQFGRGPRSVMFIANGQLPKTPSGKIKRFQLTALLDSLVTLERVDFK